MAGQMHAGNITDAERWAAVARRDTSQDGQFVYAVTSTRIFCRPSCPSRRPAREGVAFYPDPRAAEQAGYRACRRCEPAAAGPPATRRVLEARAYMDAHAETPITLSALAKVVGLSASHLQRQFTRIVGVSPRAYASALRVDRLKAHLRAGHTVARATYAAGYGSGSRPYAPTVQLGMTPATYRRGGDGVTIRYTTVTTSLGPALIAATDRGLCAVTLGDDETTLGTSLHQEFPRATIVRADTELAGWATEVTKLANTGGMAHDLPLDVAGTSFQCRVWELLRGIPSGETRSYSEIAAALGTPNAVRAVARACASNRVALVIPCHRVVRADGALGGYRWGIERKRALLNQERAPE